MEALNIKRKSAFTPNPTIRPSPITAKQKNLVGRTHIPSAITCRGNHVCMYWGTRILVFGKVIRFSYIFMRSMVTDAVLLDGIACPYESILWKRREHRGGDAWNHLVHRAIAARVYTKRRRTLTHTPTTYWLRGYCRHVCACLLFYHKYITSYTLQYITCKFIIYCN